MQSTTQGQRAAPRWGPHSETARSTSNVVSSGAPSTTTSSSPVVTVASPARTLSQPSLSPDLISTLISSVTNAVTQQLSALLPTSSAIASSWGCTSFYFSGLSGKHCHGHGTLHCYRSATSTYSS